MEVSKQELSRAIDALRCHGEAQMTFPYWHQDVLAEHLLNYVEKYKEPEWEAGDIVQSYDGRFYKRTCAGKWTRFGVNATWGDEQPKRPLARVGREKYL